MNIKKFFSNKQLSLLEGNYLKHNTSHIINTNTNIFYNKSLIASYYHNNFNFTDIYNITKSLLKKNTSYNTKIGGKININDNYWKKYDKYKIINNWSIKINNTIVHNPINYCKFGYDQNYKLTPSTNKHYDIYKYLNNHISNISNINKSILKFNNKKLKVCQNYVIPNSCFTTCSIYKNLRPAVFRNNADIFSCFGCFDSHHASLLLPQYNLNFDMNNSLLFIRQNQWITSNNKINMIFHLFNKPSLLNYKVDIINKNTSTNIPKLERNIRRSRRNKLLKIIKNI